MIVEERIYTCYTGKAPEFLAIYEAEGLAIQTRILPRMIGYFTTDLGPLNTIVHMWAYDDYAQREAKRKELAADPDWQIYVKKVQPLFLTQESRILVPTRFSPIR